MPCASHVKRDSGGVVAVRLLQWAMGNLAGYSRQVQIAAHQHSPEKVPSAWLQLYGLLRYSCLRTGAATCSCMAIRQAHLTHPSATGSMPTAFNTSTSQRQLTSASLELFFLLWSFQCPTYKTSTAGKHCWCVTWLSGVKTHSYGICRSRIAGLYTCLFLTLV